MPFVLPSFTHAGRSGAQLALPFCELGPGIHRMSVVPPRCRLHKARIAQFLRVLSHCLKVLRL